MSAEDDNLRDAGKVVRILFSDFTLIAGGIFLRGGKQQGLHKPKRIWVR